MNEEELYQRLAALEQAQQERAHNEQLQDFMSNYGEQFSNNKGLGSYLMDTLMSQGVTISPEAVSSVLEQLRAELNALSDVLSNNVQTMTDKINETLENVTNDNNADSTGMSSMVPEDLELPPLPPEMTGEVPPAPAGQSPAPEAAAPAAPVPEAPAEVPPAPAEQPPAPEAVPPVPPVPQTAVSDKRLKFINSYKQKISDMRMKKIETPKAAKPVAPAPVDGVNVGRFAALVGGR
jgi:hypothetical protein